MKHTLLSCIAAAAMLSPISAAANPRAALLIGYPDAASIDNFQEEAACKLFKELHPDGTVIAAGDNASISAEKFDCIWVHIDRVGIGAGWDRLPEAFRNDATVAALSAFLRDGGNLFLSKQATQLIVPLGRVDAKFAPNIFSDGDGGPGTDVWTVQAQVGYWFINETDNPEGLDPSQYYDRRNHAIYDGLSVSNQYPFETYPLLGTADGSAMHREDHNCIWDLNALDFAVEGKNTVEKFEAEANAIVLGQWGHVQDHAVAGIVEFLPEAAARATTSGRIIANGLAAFELSPRSGVNGHSDNVRKLAANTLTYLLPNTATSVNGIEISEENAAPEYYNLQGMRVNPETAPAGVYVVRTGSDVKKVFVK